MVLRLTVRSMVATSPSRKLSPELPEDTLPNVDAELPIAPPVMELSIEPPMMPLTEEPGVISRSSRCSRSTVRSSGRAIVTPMSWLSRVISDPLVAVDRADATCIYTCATVIPCFMALARSTVRWTAGTASVRPSETACTPSTEPIASPTVLAAACRSSIFSP